MSIGKRKLVHAARSLRKRSTRTEISLWKFLSNKGMVGFKFRRQHPMRGFILDFYCPEKRLAIEIDGKIHDNQKEYDAARQAILEDCGIRFLRFKNEEVESDVETVLKTVKRKLDSIKDESFVDEGSPLCAAERG